MTSTQILINLEGLAVISWIVWHFWLWQRNNATATKVIDYLDITVKGGYQPATIIAKAGHPITLNFTRKESSPCGEEVVFPDFGKRAYLPEGKTISIEINPQKPSVYEFTCGMNMYKGKLIVE
ncbi:MAG: cupredoxin domain-containing protein [Blastocatellia bacterium]|nr:cupredoxin domain-containing protein [Blastocatellia bacterium]